MFEPERAATITCVGDPGRDDRRGPPNSFGTGGLTFEVARSRVPWTVWKSLLVGLIGVVVLGLAVWDGNVGLEAMSGLLLLLSAIWTAGAWRSDHDARRLEARQGPPPRS
jgi:hypothetical protein